MKAGTNLELFFNERSLHGQFPDLSSFGKSIARVMEMREVAWHYGRDIRCHRNTADAAAVGTKSVRAVLAGLERDTRSALWQWLAKTGPFWDEEQQHGRDDYLECQDEVVTDTGIGEAAFCVFRGAECAIVSAKPSDWSASPLSVAWREDEGPAESVEIHNYTEVAVLRAAVEDRPKPMLSWDALELSAKRRCPDLVFSPKTFGPLQGIPFHPVTAERLLRRLLTLQAVKNGFDTQRRRTPEANRIYRTQFSGEMAPFSDSSKRERNRFRSQLTFAHPTKPGESLFCPWHGKVRMRKTQPVRIHFSWPIKADTPLFVVYVGPKITKR